MKQWIAKCASHAFEASGHLLPADYEPEIDEPVSLRQQVVTSIEVLEGKYFWAGEDRTLPSFDLALKILRAAAAAETSDEAHAVWASWSGWVAWGHPPPVGFEEIVDRLCRSTRAASEAAWQVNAFSEAVA